MKGIISLIALIITSNLNAQNMVTNEILQKVFLIKYGNSTGTTFLVSINNNDYLITAKHIFPDSLKFKTPVEIEIFKNDGWIKFTPTLLFHSNPNVDVAVLDLKSNDQKMNLFDLGGKNYYLSQDCYFLGFPFGLKMDDKGGNFNKGFPVPFVKKAIISSFVTDTTQLAQIFLDGHNNPGFSGGPVVISNSVGENQHVLRIIGVVSAYLNEEKLIKTPFGDLKNNENSGIIVSYSFDYVVEILKRK